MDRKKRPARLLGLVLFLPLVATGCRTIVPTKPAASPTPPPSPQQVARPPAQGNTPGALVKNDFHRTPTQDQRFNVHIELGKQYMREQRFEPALVEFKKALEACGQSSGLRGSSHRTEQLVLAHRKIGSAQMSLGKGVEAENELKLASKLGPNDPRVWNDLGYMYSMQQRFADAEQCLRRALKADPDSPLVRQNLGLAIAYQGRTAEGLEMLTQAGGKALGHYHVGFALARQGRTVEARDEYRKALEIEPKLAKAQEALARLDNPKSPQPLGALTADKSALTPIAASATSPVLAMPAPASLAAVTAVASTSARPAPAATVAPRSAAASGVALQPPRVTGIPLPVPVSSPVDSGLRPTSFGASPAARTATVAPKRASNLPAPAPAPARTVQPARTPAPAAVIRPAPPLGAPVDVELRPTSYGTIAPAKPAPPVSAPASALIPPPIPASVDTSAGQGSTTLGAIPPPVPVSRHVAAPTLERSGDPMSVPAADAQLMRLPATE